MPRFRPTLILLPLLLFLVIYQYRRINGRENSYLETLRHEHILNEGGLTPEHEIHHILLAHTTVIFSKSYCPYSIKVKGYLVDKGSRLKLQPPPYVVELDLHPRGPALQKALEERTGRATVPNIFVGGTSIGGGDEIEQLYQEGKLVDKIRDLGGDGIQQIFVLKQ